jgi:hypothetical protein
VVGLAGALGEVFDLLVLDANLAAEKFILAFELVDVGGRDRSREVGACRVQRRRAVEGMSPPDQHARRSDDLIILGARLPRR